MGGKILIEKEKWWKSPFPCFLLVLPSGTRQSRPTAKWNKLEMVCQPFCFHHTMSSYPPGTLFCSFASFFSICWPLPSLYLCCHTHGYSSNIAFTASWGLCHCVLCCYSISSLCLADIAHNIARDAYNVLCVWTMSLIVRGSPSHLAEYIDAHTCYPHNLHSKEKKHVTCEYIHIGLVTDKQEPIARCTHCEKWPWTQNEKETKRDEGFSGKQQLSNPDFCSNPRSEHKVDMF